MKYKQYKSITHYLVLIVVMVAGAISITFTGRNQDLSYLLIATLAIFHFLWGVIHHHSEGTLHHEIVLEYLLISLIGMITVQAVLYFL